MEMDTENPNAKASEKSPIDTSGKDNNSGSNTSDNNTTSPSFVARNFETLGTTQQEDPNINTNQNGRNSPASLSPHQQLPTITTITTTINTLHRDNTSQELDTVNKNIHDNSNHDLASAKALTSRDLKQEAGEDMDGDGHAEDNAADVADDDEVAYDSLAVEPPPGSAKPQTVPLNNSDDEEPPAEPSREATGEEPKAKRPRLSDEGFHNKLSDTPDSLVLSPPPDTTSESEPLNEDPEDEIVVQRVHLPHARPKKTNAPASAGDNDHESGMTPEMNGKNTPKTALKARGSEQRPKRKRASLYDDLSEDRINSMLGETTDDFADVSTVSATVPKGLRVPNIVSVNQSVRLGVWRESEAPDPDKHVVKGFIDSRDRLRTRIQPYNSAGDIITGRFPLKPGPGGSWTTFHNIIFDDHLVHLDQHQVKEYVKIRALLIGTGSENDSMENIKLTVQQAIKACLNRGPPPEGQLPPLIAYGVEIPEHARIVHPRAEKRRRAAGLLASGSNPTLMSQPPIQPEPTVPEAPLPDIPGHRPTKILLGYWKHSSERNDRDKHAVFGILGNNDMFRVKVGRETRDGRPMTGNFPQGAGALWISITDWIPEPYLEGLSKEELKEFARVRQFMIDHGEHGGSQEDNIKTAVLEAKDRARILASRSKNGHNVSNGGAAAAAAAAPTSPGTTADVSNNNNDSSAATYETRRRSGQQQPTLVPATARGQQGSSQTPSFRAANRTGSLGLDSRLERANSLATRAVSHIEANQAKIDQREAAAVAAAAARMGPLASASGDGTTDSMATFRDNINRLNNVWSSQEAHRIRTGGEDAKMYMGIKYERKMNGPFQGKLVSQGSIISIDGEDYVEYRVLTKPTFI